MSEHGKCMYCGGMVDADGKSAGGMLEEETDSERTPPAVNAAGDSTQRSGAEESVRNAEKRFVRAVRSGR